MNEIEFEDIYPDKNILFSTLYSVVIWTKPKRYLEIGVSEGNSLKQVIENTKLEFVALCDTWGGSFGGFGRGNHAHIERLLDELGYKGEVLYMDGDSRVLLPDYFPEEGFDLILVDGDHTYNGAWYDLTNSWRLLNPGGHIIFDDLIHPQHTYLNELADVWGKEVGAEVVYKNIKRPHGVVVYKK